jgi:hypothetical protein
MIPEKKGPVSDLGITKTNLHGDFCALCSTVLFAADSLQPA